MITDSRKKDQQTDGTIIIPNKLFFELVEEELSQGHQVRIILNGGSMYPFMHENDIISLEPILDEPSIGDVLLFRFCKHHIVHRIVAKRDGIYIMQGDNNIGHEEARRSDLLATVVSIQRKNGKTITNNSRRWQRRSRLSILRGKIKRNAYPLYKTLKSKDIIRRK